MLKENASAVYPCQDGYADSKLRAVWGVAPLFTANSGWVEFGAYVGLDIALCVSLFGQMSMEPSTSHLSVQNAAGVWPLLAIFTPRECAEPKEKQLYKIWWMLTRAEQLLLWYCQSARSEALKELVLAAFLFLTYTRWGNLKDDGLYTVFFFFARMHAVWRPWVKQTNMNLHVKQELGLTDRRIGHRAARTAARPTWSMLVPIPAQFSLFWRVCYGSPPALERHTIYASVQRISSLNPTQLSYGH